MQSADYNFSKSFCDLEPTRWECNSVQLLRCLVLSKCVCVHNQGIDPHGLVGSSRSLSRRLLSWQVLSGS